LVKIGFDGQRNRKILKKLLRRKTYILSIGGILPEDNINAFASISGILMQRLAASAKVAFFAAMKLHGLCYNVLW
jgi:hypothetical protein